MEELTVKRVMDRLLINDNFKKIERTTVATYMKDLCTICEILPVLKTEFDWVTIKDYKGVLPEDCLRVKKVYLCKDDAELHPAVHADNALMAAGDQTIQRDVGDKVEYGEWQVEGDILFTDISSYGKVEIQYTKMRVDDMGFPILPYDGSLMEAVLNWVKFHYYGILAEQNIIADKYVTKAEQQYDWYIAQYLSKEMIPSEDEAITIANSWQRLVHTRNRNARGGGHPQFMLTASKNKYKYRSYR